MAIIDRSVQYPGRYILTPAAGLENGFYIEAAPGTVYAAGTLYNRALFLSLAPIQVFDTVVQPEAWVEDSTHASLGFYYRASIAIAAASYLQIPAVTFNPTDVLTKQLCPVAVSYAGGIYIYAKRALTEAITIPTIELTRPTSSLLQGPAEQVIEEDLRHDIATGQALHNALADPDTGAIKLANDAEEDLEQDIATGQALLSALADPDTGAIKLATDAEESLEEALNAVPERPIKMKKVLIYYGYPIAIHGAWSVNSAVAAYQGYDLVVFGDQYNNPSHDAYEDTCEIMAELKLVKPHIQLVGYVPIGNNTPTSLSEEEIIERIDWWSAMGADGVFLDEFGYDYLVTRERQNFCVSYAHSKSMFVFVNSWNDNYVFSNTLNEVPWISGFEPNPDSLPCLLNERDYSLYENLFWSAELVNGVLTGNTIGATIWNIHRPYNYRYASQAEYGGKSFAQQYGTQIICLDGFHSNLDDEIRKAMQTISIFTCKILNINGVGFGDQFWGSGGQIVDWDLPNYDLDERNLHEIAVTNQTVGEDTIPMTYTAYVNGVEYAATFDVDSIADTEYTPAKRFVKVDGVPVVDAWDTLFAVRHKVDGFEAELASVVAEIQAIVDGVEDDITALGNLAQLQADLAALKTTLETTNTTVTQDVEDAIASLALIVSGFQYTLREW